MHLLTYLSNYGSPTSQNVSAVALEIFKQLEDIHAVDTLVKWDENIQLDDEGKCKFPTQPNLGANPNDEVAFYPNYRADALLQNHTIHTDYFIIGLYLLAWIAEKDWSKDADFKLLSSVRKQPNSFNAGLHPALCNLVYELTALSVQDRLTEYDAVIEILENYTNIEVVYDRELDDSEVSLLTKFRNRLFDFTKRNRAIYFQPNSKFINITLMSWANSQAWLWDEQGIKKIMGSKDVVLNSLMDFHAYPQLTKELNKLRLEDNRHIQEYGFGALQFMPVFLNWVNYKDDPNLPIQSPLLMIPASLERTKRLKEDAFILRLKSQEAIVNPIVAHMLKENFGIILPEKVLLTPEAMEEFFIQFKSTIVQQGEGIKLINVCKPKIIRYKSQKRIDKDNAHNAALQALSSLAVDSEVTEEEELFSLDNQLGTTYTWELDCTHINIGIVNSKKLSLVADYNFIVENQPENPSWQAITQQQKETINVDNHTNSAINWYDVIAADPTQHNAIAYSDSQKSYVIQGPPGTGKSQTITNLIAHYVAQGKSVLFVCEKRAALDVVYHRLKQQQLDDLCTYIHDSQLDKKEFIFSLKHTYETFLNIPSTLVQVESERNSLLSQIEGIVAKWRQYHELGKSTVAYIDTPTFQFLNRYFAIQNTTTDLTLAQQELVPMYADYLQSEAALRNISESITKWQYVGFLKDAPFMKINEMMINKEHPINLITQNVQKLEAIHTTWDTILSKYQIEKWNTISIDNLHALQDALKQLHPYAQKQQLTLLMPSHKDAKAFDLLSKQLEKEQKQVQKLSGENKYWKHLPTNDEVEELINVVEKYEPKFFRFFYSKWRKTKQFLETNYEFSAHNLKPSYLTVLGKLKQYYVQINTVDEKIAQFANAYGVSDIQKAVLDVKRLRASAQDGFYADILPHTQAIAMVESLYSIDTQLDELHILLKQLINFPQQYSLLQIKEWLAVIQQNISELNLAIPILQLIHKLPIAFKQVLSTLPIHLSNLESVVAAQSFQRLLNRHPIYADYNQVDIQSDVQLLDRLYKQLLQCNVQYIRERIKAQFEQHVSLLQSSTTVLDADQLAFRKQYNEGKKILENEFGKKIRYKSIRNLIRDDSVFVIKDLKPIWLMSPLSVSDVLPITHSEFDVVIFDEASQIPMEDSVPALFRAPQTIIVGDEQQMPPTNFFAIKNIDEAEEDEHQLLQVDSLLEQGSKKLHNEMLLWHYRSKYESLISFSNYNFYNAQLITIPDQFSHASHLPVDDVTERLPEALQNIFRNSISFHHISDAIYKERKNQKEANYIAQLIYKLLMHDVKESIAVVAFSKEQQQEIENAIDALAAKDSAFDAKLEAAYQRMDGDQFVGLIIKNLENIQGDERDIVIMSVCYGYDERGKMLMNFGPINRKGGEKRLNVLFSRAKKHMVVVSSIEGQAITNDYNLGARSLKHFLSYAKAINEHQHQLTHQILQKSNHNIQQSETTTTLAIVAAIGQRLEQNGYKIDYNVGHSQFKISIAIKSKDNEEKYSLGILIDDDLHYNVSEAIEVMYNRPSVLGQFGWKVIAVKSKDWVVDQNQTWQYIINNIEN